MLQELKPYSLPLIRGQHNNKRVANEEKPLVFQITRELLEKLKPFRNLTLFGAPIDY